MVRQNITPDFSHKVFEAYTDFSGGLNSEISNEKLKDTESPIFQNVDISGHGSIKRRYGRTKLTNLAATYAQGMFLYRIRLNGVLTPFLIVALDGNLYHTDLNGAALTQISLGQTFQSTRPVEAVQYGDTLFIATGSFLAEIKYDGTNWTGSKSTAYKPTVQEVIYIGTNAIADNPNSYIQDGNPGVLSVVGVQFTDPTTNNTISSGAVNQKLNITAYITVVTSGDVTEYQWEVKKSSDTNWPATPAQAFDSTMKTWSFTPDTSTNYDFRVTIRKQGTTTPTSDYVTTGYPINDTSNVTNKPLTLTGITTCNRIMLHFDRILLAGDTTTPGQIYISDLDNPRYFPTNNTINVDTGKQEDLTAIIRFQNMLVLFTTTSIQTLVGHSPDDFSRYLIHDGIGCSQGKTAKVVGNQVLFLSSEGIQSLRPNPYRLDTMNVNRVDIPIKTEIKSLDQTDANAAFNDAQYWLTFPNNSVTYRFYFERGAWVKDSSTKLNIVQSTVYNDVVYELTKNGNIYKHDKTVYTDDNEVYDMIVETKYYDLDASFNYKKLKRLYILAKHYSDHSVPYFITLYSDSAAVLAPDTGSWITDANNNVVWSPSNDPNFEFKTGTTLGQWNLGTNPLGDVKLSVQKAGVSGKCRRAKIKVKHSDQYACEIYGFGLEFRLAKPY